MIRKRWKLMMTLVNNEDGFTMILALILLMLLTIIGVAAINTSTTGTMITAAEEAKRASTFVAESAVEQATCATAILRTQFVDVGQKRLWSAMASGTDATSLPQPRWSFALNGSDTIGNGHNVTGTGAHTRPLTGSKWMDRFSAGNLWSTGKLENDPINSYEVRIWNNADSPIPAATELDQNDWDGLVVVGAIASGSRNTRAAVEVVLNGGFGPGPVIGGYAQSGASGGKNSSAADLEAISFGTSANPESPAINTSLSGTL